MVLEIGKSNIKLKSNSYEFFFFLVLTDLKYKNDVKIDLLYTTTTMMTTSLSNNKTFEEIESEMEKAMVNGIRNITSFDVLAWHSEYSEWNHEKMLTIQNILSECTNDDIIEYIRFTHTKDLKKVQLFLNKINKHTKLFRIRNIGLEIHNRGGFTAMQANFYIFFNFLIPRNDVEEMIKFRDVKYLWDGVGDWEE